MDFDYSPKVQDLRARLLAFMNDHVYPNEHRFHEEIETNRKNGNAWIPTKIIEELKPKARAAGLWNLFLPFSKRVPEGLTNLEYAPLCEIMGRVPWSHPRCSTARRPTPATWRRSSATVTKRSERQWLDPLLRGEIRSAFLMTEPAVASSDATNIQCSMTREGDEYVINGRKWWSSGAGDPRCAVYIVMGKTNPDAARHEQQSMIVVPADAPGHQGAAPRCRCSATTMRRTATWKSTSRTCACRWATCCSAKVAASRSRRAASGRVASTIACASSAWPSARSN